MWFVLVNWRVARAAIQGLVLVGTRGMREQTPTEVGALGRCPVGLFVPHCVTDPRCTGLRAEPGPSCRSHLGKFTRKNIAQG